MGGVGVEVVAGALVVHDLLGQALPGEAGGDVEEVDVGPALGREGQGQVAQVLASDGLRVVEVEPLTEVGDDGVVLLVDVDHADEAVGPELQSLGPAALDLAVLDDRAVGVATLGARLLGVGQGHEVGLHQGAEAPQEERGGGDGDQSRAGEAGEGADAVPEERGGEGEEAGHGDDDDGDPSGGGEVVVVAEQPETREQRQDAQHEAERTQVTDHCCSRLSMCR